MKKLALALALCGLSVPALAAPPPKPASSGSEFGSVIAQGQIEVGGLFAWFKSDAFDMGLVVANGGYMYTDELELRLSWTGILGDASGGLITPGADWYFKNLDLPVIPYAGGGYSLAYGDLDDASSIDLHFGAKQFLSERIALDYRFTYLQPTDSDIDSFQFLQIGFSYYL